MSDNNQLLGHNDGHSGNRSGRGEHTDTPIQIIGSGDDEEDRTHEYER